jgi:hypothetical protein
MEKHKPHKHIEKNVMYKQKIRIQNKKSSKNKQKYNKNRNKVNKEYTKKLCLSHIPKPVKNPEKRPWCPRGSLSSTQNCVWPSAPRARPAETGLGYRPPWPAPLLV